MPRRARKVREVGEQCVDRHRTAIGKARLEVIPDLLVGVEIGRIGGKAFEVQARMPGAQRADGGPLVNRPAVPQDDDGSLQVPQQQAKEGGHLDMADVDEVQVAVEAEPVATRADGNRGDRRDPLVGVAMAQARRGAPRRPSAAHRRNEQEATLVEEGEVRPQAPDFFLIATQRVRFHAAIARSFRSTARRSGF